MPNSKLSTHNFRSPYVIIPQMRRTTSMPSNLADVPTTGLPSVSYYPPILATLLASILLLLVAGMLGFFGILNVITAWGRASNNEGDASFLGAGVCGLLTLVALLGTAYFVI